MADTSKLSLLFLLTLTTTTTLLLLATATASPTDHRYNVGDNVPIFVNKVGPLNNPSETYHYHDLPFCRPDPVIPKKETLGEVLNGDRLANTLYTLEFREEKIEHILCEKKLKVDDFMKFRNAVSSDYYFQMYYDDLPLWAFIGKVEKESQEFPIDEKGTKYYLFKHVQFDVLYNDNQVIEIKAFADPNHAVDITGNDEINLKFTYSVLWNTTSIDYVNRMDKYSRASSLPARRRILWFSFINSIVIIVLLMGLLILLFMRHLKNDLRKFSVGDEEEDKEVGWKYIHSDVFRCPPQMPLFCAVIGSGTHLLIVISILFCLAFLEVLYPYNRGVLSTSLVVIYVLTSPAAGYSAASFYGQFDETGWEKCLILTGILYLGPLFLIVLTLNTVAISVGSTVALPFGTIVVILLVYSLVTIPLIAFGGVVGHRFSSQFQAPSTTKRCPREIPSLVWYMKTPVQMFLGGLLPFSAIVLELHHLYASLWGYKLFTQLGIVFITFIILVVLVTLLSVGLTYIQLTVEDHTWWWRSIFRGGSTAIFMLCYGIYFYAKSNMSGFMQLTFFFGYNALFCYALFLMLGTIGFRASWMFVQHIYNAVKSE